MKNQMLMALGCIVGLIFVRTAKADVFNEGFESGSFADWTVSVEYGHSYQGSHYTVGPTGDIHLMSPTNYPFDPLTNPYIKNDIKFIDDVTAPEGNRYLKLTPGRRGWRAFTAPDGGSYNFYDQNYRVVLSRPFFIAAGQSLSLWVNFLTEELPNFNDDDLEVRINGQTIFELSVDNVWPFGDRSTGMSTSGWTNVMWSPAATGNYTLSLVASQDDQLFSSASFDNITIIPEPNPSVLVAAGLALSAGWKKAFRKTLI